MPLNDPSNAPRPDWLKALWILGGLGLVFVGWRIVALGVADHYASSHPARALAWRSDHPEALLARSEQVAKDPAKAAEAGDLARRALRANPLDGRPYRVLGQLADAAGNREGAVVLYGQAAARSPQDLPSQAWMLEYHLRRGEAVPALAYLDVLLSFRTYLLPRMKDVLNGMASTPELHEPLADVLARSPVWRTQMLVQVSRTAEDSGAIAPLFERLRKAPGGLAPTELSAWLDRLVADGQWGPAYLTWASQLPAERQRELGNVYNGGFEWEPGPGGFDWRFGKVRGARIGRMAGQGVAGRVALRVAFEDQRVNFSQVSQLLALPPGRFRLQMRARPDSLRTERGLVWTLTCVPGGQVLGETEPLRGNGPWRELAVVFTVPAAGAGPDCGGQWLTLRLPARIPAEQRIGGRAWFDDVKIFRQSETISD